MVHLLQFKRTTGDLIKVCTDQSLAVMNQEIVGNCLKGIQDAGGALRRILQVVPMNADKGKEIKEKQGRKRFSIKSTKGSMISFSF